MRLTFDDCYGKSVSCIPVYGNRLYLGFMRRDFHWSEWRWHSLDHQERDPVKLGKDTHAAKAKLREMLS